jgi:uncharacterized protein (UPF0335 family)
MALWNGEVDRGNGGALFREESDEPDGARNIRKRARGELRRLIERREEEKRLAEDIADVFHDVAEYKSPHQRTRRSMRARKLPD